MSLLKEGQIQGNRDGKQHEIRREHDLSSLPKPCTCMSLLLFFVFKIYVNKVCLSRGLPRGALFHLCFGLSLSVFLSPCLFLESSCERGITLILVGVIWKIKIVSTQFSLTNYNTDFKAHDTNAFMLMSVWVNRFPGRKEAGMSWVFGKYREHGDGHLPQRAGSSLSIFTFICLGSFCLLVMLQLRESQRICLALHPM